MALQRKVNKLVAAFKYFDCDPNGFSRGKGFYYLRYISPSTIQNYDNFDDNTNKPFNKIIEYLIPDKYQIGE